VRSISLIVLQENVVIVQYQAGLHAMLREFGMSVVGDDGPLPFNSATGDFRLFAAPECYDPELYKVWHTHTTRDVWSFGQLIRWVSVGFS
jgi:hypothetical protein